jgi:hypothetical protein
MKLKTEVVNGYLVLVDEEEEIIAGDLILWNGKVKTAIDTEYIHPSHKIIFAEPELNLDGVPVFEWRDFEVEKLAKDSDKSKCKHFRREHTKEEVYDSFEEGFIQCYKSNPAKYTESDLRGAIKMAVKGMLDSGIKGWTTITENEIIQSLQKQPKYVVMESEEFEVPYFDESGSSKISGFKFFTNSEGKQQGTVKELIWT